ncbi:A-kinase anchor protein 8-like isoform X1 [Phyllopteryx taeniolatus]|uniref:A-kinase anchor protein 8-like isoform X1 n=1 Tax=Phyllopteryx taeniolatus TaxID=161469 RepID=UPI002AD1D0B4|nr:A-kinase anchor protein 8-like isoform X1 [Phyllopteryx taeniolatus]
MEGRNYGSGFSNWGGGGSGNRGSGNFDLFGGNYKNSMSGYGGYGGGNSKRGLSGSSMLHQKITHADEVIAKINQRLDMLTQLEGGMKGGRGDRFGQFESFDSLSSSSRDLYRSGGSSYGCDDGRGDNMLLGQRGGSGFGGGMGQGGGGGFNSLSSSYGVAKMRQNMRESFTSGSGGGGWAGAGRRSPRRGGGSGGRGSGGGFGSYRSDPMSLGGGGRGSGHSPGGGRGKLPSLLSNRMYSESGGFHQGPSQGPHDFPGRHFGGGPRAGRQRGRKRPLNKQVKPQNDVQKKRKQMLTPADEPESKINKTESTDTGASQVKADKNGDNNEELNATEETTDGDSGAAKQDEGAEKKAAQDKQTSPRAPAKSAKMKKKRGFQERVMFACSVCKFRSFYKEEMERHLESRFHKDHFKFLSGQLSKPTTDFLQEYLQNKFQKTDQMVRQLENHSAAICQMYRDQDLTKDLGMEHFLKKVEAAHCSACDIFIPMELHLIQKHIKSHDHNYNRKGMMEQSKRASLSVARSILNHKVIGKKLESYLKGENPFTGNQEGQDASNSMVVDATEEQKAAVTVEKESEAAEAAAQQAAEVEAAEEVKMADDEKKEKEEEATLAGMEGEEEEQVMREGEAEEEEGFEVGEEEEEEGDVEGYVVHDEVDDDEDGAEVATAVEDDEHKE